MRHSADGRGRFRCGVHRFSAFRVRTDVVERLSMKIGLQQLAIALMSEY